jgi:hypothetical protein
MDESQLIDIVSDFTKFAPDCLVIRSKSGSIEPFALNRAQLYTHEKLEKQLRDTKKVRALVLKGRQQGLSTYIQGRYFYKMITRLGTKVYILTHEAEATKNLFEMTQRYYDKLPSGLACKADKSSSKELYFKQYDSGYAIGTAGNKGAGRSQTIQLFHGSEVGFWPNAEEHARGVLQAVSNEAGTEIILESTANGIGNYYHNMWKAAESGTSEYIAIFIPWYWQSEYTSSDEGFNTSDEETHLISIYGSDGLTNRHLAWRRLKIAEFSNDFDIGLESFKQEFPFSATEAFLNPIANVFINSKHVAKARKNRIDHNDAARLVIGVDVAIGDSDKTAIIRRRGRVAYNLQTFRNLNTMEIAGLLKHIIENEKPHKVYIDCIGVGAGVVDRLKEHNFHFVEGINVARSANNKTKFRNLRAELWHEMREWLIQEMPVEIPDKDELHGDLCNLGYKYDSSGRLQIESKDDLKARGMPSSDTSDALSLTFYSGFYEKVSDFAVTTVPRPRPGMFI